MEKKYIFLERFNSDFGRKEIKRIFSISETTKN